MSGSNGVRRWVSVLVWGFVGVWGAFAVVRVFGLERTYYLRIFMAFTPYVVLFSLVPLALALGTRRWIAASVACVVTVALAVCLIPRMAGSPDPGDGPRLRVMSQNMKIGAADPAAMVALVQEQGIDLLAVEEYTPRAEAALAAAGLDDLLPYSASHPLSGAIGSAIYSRYPIDNSGYQLFGEIFGGEYATVHVPGAKPFFFEAVHTRAPALPSELTDYMRSLAAVPRVGATGIPQLLAGDFNATFDQAPLRALRDSGYTDVASRLGDGMVPTWPYDGRHVPRITLDHILAAGGFGVVSFGAQTISRTDHRAIYAVLTLPTR